MNRLHPRVRAVWAGQAAVLAAVLAAVTLVVSRFLLTLPAWVPPAVFVVALVVGVGLATARYRVWRYEVRDDALYLERGVFTRVRTVVPFVRIQHVDSSRGPVERLAGLASTVVYTAGSRGADVTVPGLTPTGADDLRERLKRLAIGAEGDDAV
ncbi:PH domain-containing protein [Haloplanus halobius]|uniref:PH domain-containing protein n=1 Tax=Haloplanus halobius TaxID=2934938 RepID=UPI00200BD9AF|nr:PH domain-containing protein [Haloplanus sp. XH21]